MCRLRPFILLRGTEGARRASWIFLLVGSVSCGATPTDFEPGVSGDWPTAPPESQGLSSSVLADLSDRIAHGEFGLTNSLLIVRNGILVWERYFRDATPTDIHTMYSVTKSVTSALIGIAVDGGSIPSVDVKVLDLFPEYSTVENMSPEKESIT